MKTLPTARIAAALGVVLFCTQPCHAGNLGRTSSATVHIAISVPPHIRIISDITDHSLGIACDTAPGSTYIIKTPPGLLATPQGNCVTLASSSDGVGTAMMMVVAK